MLSWIRDKLGIETRPVDEENDREMDRWDSEAGMNICDLLDSIQDPDIECIIGRADHCLPRGTPLPPPTFYPEIAEVVDPPKTPAQLARERVRALREEHERTGVMPIDDISALIRERSFGTGGPAPFSDLVQPDYTSDKAEAALQRLREIIDETDKALLPLHPFARARRMVANVLLRMARKVGV